MNENMTAQWKYVIPIEKADFSDDKWVIEGVVAGPGFVDAMGDEFLPDAIKSMADYINSNPLPLLDWHGKNYTNTVVAPEMGEIYKAWVDEDGLLRVEGELDKEHAAAKWLKKKLDNKERPRKFGLSVHGFAQPRPAPGRLGRQFVDVIPDEISITTRPFYQPSLGTVISKAIDEAAAESVDEGDKSSMSKEAAPKAADAPMSPEENKDSLLPAVDAEPEKEGVTPVKEVPEPDVMQNVAVAQPVEEVSVEKSENDQMDAFATRMVDVIRNIVRQEIGNSKVEPVAPVGAEQPSEVAVEKSEVDRLAVIEKALTDLTDKMERVLDTVPEVKAPGVLVSKSEVDEAREALAALDPRERITLGFKLSEQTKLR